MKKILLHGLSLLVLMIVPLAGHVSAAGKPPIPAGCPGTTATGSSTVDCSAIPQGCPGTTQNGTPTTPPTNCPYAAAAAAGGSTVASCAAATGSSKDAVLKGVGQTGNTPDCTGTGVDTIVSTAVKILSMVIGIAAVIMILISGFKYVTAGGDSNKVSSAKSTLIYALIGLVVVGFAQFLVHFVLTSTPQ